MRTRCTAQLRLDLIAERQPWRLLLENTNRKRFLLYHATLRQRGFTLEHLVHRLDVINRGSWAKPRFSHPSEPAETP